MKIAQLVSGGLDSCVLAADMIKQGHTVYPILMDDKSPNYALKDRPTSYAIAQKLGIARNVIEARIYENDRLRLNDEMGYIPGYKLVMMVTALSYAADLGCERLALAYCAENGTYADEHDEHIHDTFNLFNAMYSTDIAPWMPYRSMQKSEVVKIGSIIGAPMHLSSSCDSTVHAGTLHCGTCKWCNNRQRAFYISGVKDPTIYQVTSHDDQDPN